MMCQKRKYSRLPMIVRISLWFFFICVLFTVGIYRHFYPSIYIPIKSKNQSLADWQYQNSITGEWFQWTTTPENHSWTVKWLNTPPNSSLGVIVYLAPRGESSYLKQSLFQLSRLLINTPRPVVIFHEGDYVDNDLQQSFARTITPQFPLAFERIHFGNQSRSGKQEHRLGYLHMCRFFTRMLPHHPLLSLFTFYWRLDAHSYIFGSHPIADPFERMQEQGAQYGFIMVNEDGDGYVTHLWSFFHQFLQNNSLQSSTAVRQTQTTFFGEYSLAIIFTNFAIANVSLFRDHPLIQDWLTRVDQSNGIYQHRWGDAPVHTLALTQFLPRNSIVRFRYFGYMHRREYVCAIRTPDKQCKQQIQPFLFDSRIEYLNYPDGCWPSTRNPLCHYYPEIVL